MKKLLLAFTILFIFSCEENPLSIDDNPNYNPNPQESYPFETGLLDTSYVIEAAEALPNISILNSFPSEFDLSLNMPPVLEQKEQKSAVAWAAAYYLKSFQEKIQHNYEYLTDNEVMSPAFIYNQLVQGNCDKPIAIEDALYILKANGVPALESFPYNETDCSTLPTQEQLEFAQINKIASYHNVLNNTINASTISILKSLLLEQTPILLGIKIDAKFKSSSPKNENGIYVYQHKDALTTFNHAMLIVGFDDSLQAFKIINSWGTNWANEGFGYISYNFFLPEDDANFESGLISLHVAYDVE